MKQTAVEWLYEKIKSNIDAEDGSMNMNWLYDDTFQQAKEMEKKQFIDFGYKVAEDANYGFDANIEPYTVEDIEKKYKTYTQSSE